MGDPQEARKLAVAVSPLPFSNVRRYRHATTAQLLDQPKALSRWPRFGFSVNSNNERHSLLPSHQITETFDLRLGAVWSLTHYAPPLDRY